MASETFENGELLLDVRTKINTNFTTVDQRVDALELVVASLPTTAYQKPSEGIPSTDLSTEVQSALTEASTAFQKPVGGIPASDLDTATQGSIVNGDAAYQVIVDGISYAELSPSIVNTLAKADTAYQKPLTGIPKTDLATAVQASLNKADTAIQPGSSLVVKPQATATPPSNGDMTFELTSNTSLTIKVKGSDGVVRSATLTLS